MIAAHPFAAIVVATLLGCLYYIAECAWWPFAPCMRCDGAGRFKPKNRRVWRTCRRCRGSGSRLRIGRRLWNSFARIRSNAK